MNHFSYNGTNSVKPVSDSATLSTERLPYQPPLLEVFLYAVEHGFVQSPPATVQFEEFSEINNEGNENERGVWDVEW